MARQLDLAQYRLAFFPGHSAVLDIWNSELGGWLVSAFFFFNKVEQVDATQRSLSGRETQFS